MNTSKSIKISLPLAPSIYEALSREASKLRRETTEHIQRILAEYAIRQKLLEKDETERLQLFWRLVERAVEEAKRICRAGDFTSAITRQAIDACLVDEEWKKGYKEYVRDDIYKNGNPLKGPINREIGFRIRAGIGGTIVKGPNGKAATEKVLGSIIQSYTPMINYDRAAVS